MIVLSQASNDSDAAMQRVAEVIESRKKKNERIVALRNGVDDFVDKVNNDYKKIIGKPLLTFDCWLGHTMIYDSRR